MKLIEKLKVYLNLIANLLNSICFLIFIVYALYYSCVTKELVSAIHAMSWAILCMVSLILRKLTALGEKIK